MSFTKNIHSNHHGLMISLKSSITVVFLMMCFTMMVKNIQCQTTEATTSTKTATASINQTTNSTITNSNSTNLNNNGSIVNNNTNSNSFDNNNTTGLNTTNNNNNNSTTTTSTTTTTTTSVPDLRGTYPTLRYIVFAKWLKSNDNLNDSRQDAQSQV